MIVWNGEVYIDKAHIDVLRDEKEYVKRRYHAVARTLAKKPFKISRKEAAGFFINRWGSRIFSGNWSKWPWRNAQR